MSNITGRFRDGLHPKGKDGGRESWRGEYKGVNQVAGWVGKGKDPAYRSGSNGQSDHVSRPLATLKDPGAFGPPPKNVNFHGGAALPNETTPDRRGLGVPLPRTDAGTMQQSQTKTEEIVLETPQRSTVSSVPSGYNRKGSKTDRLLPPPTNQVVEGRVSSGQDSSAARLEPKLKPSLPPRLPPRNNSASLASPPAASSPPPPYEVVANAAQPTESTSLNHRAVDRLGKAGISVPGLGIGQGKTDDPASSPPSSRTGQLNSLQGRVSRLNIVPPPNSNAAISTTGEPQVSNSPPAFTSISHPQAQSTSFAEKQSALKTAQSFHQDPSSISLSEAQSAATTANNFRNRRQTEIVDGAQKANSWNQKFNVTGRANGLLSGHQQQQQQQPPPLPPLRNGASRAQTASTPPATPTPAPAQTSTSHLPPPTANTTSVTDVDTDVRNQTKPPPPPPPQKKPKPSAMQAQAQAQTQTQTQRGSSAHVSPPPPVPLGTKPSFA